MGDKHQRNLQEYSLHLDEAERKLLLEEEERKRALLLEEDRRRMEEYRREDEKKRQLYSERPDPSGRRKTNSFPARS